MEQIEGIRGTPPKSNSTDVDVLANQVYNTLLGLKKINPAFFGWTNRKGSKGRRIQ